MTSVFVCGYRWRGRRRRRRRRRQPSAAKPAAVNTSGLYRVDNEWNRDRNEWLYSSIQRQRSFQGIRFFIRLSNPFETEEDLYFVLFRRVIRRPPHHFIPVPVRSTFVQYMYRQG
ncbi:hypothetical protein Bca4012_023983 [Brassica carinata]